MKIFTLRSLRIQLRRKEQSGSLSWAASRQLNGWRTLFSLDNAKEVNMRVTDMASFFLGLKSSAGIRKNQLLAYQPATALGQRRDCQKISLVIRSVGEGQDTGAGGHVP